MIQNEQIQPEARDRLYRRLAQDGFTISENCLPTRLNGGLANLNYRIDIDGTPCVLRVAPAGDIPAGAHDMVREHKVLSHLSRVFALAPDSLYLCEDKSVLGAPFQIIEYRDGRVFRGDDLGPQNPGEDLAGCLHELLADVMAQLHAVDPASCGLDGHGRPDGFVQRAAAGWSKRGLALTEGTPEVALVRQIAAWLSAALVDHESGAPTLLHCDIKLDNLMLSRDALRPVALLDWDMATRGDPLFDLATLLSYWSMPDDPDCLVSLGQMPTALPGFPSREDMIGAYARASGRSVRGLGPVTVLCQFKLGVVFLQLHDRWVNGALGDSRYARFERLGFDLLEHALATAGKMRHTRSL